MISFGHFNLDINRNNTWSRNKIHVPLFLPVFNGSFSKSRSSHVDVLLQLSWQWVWKCFTTLDKIPPFCSFQKWSGNSSKWQHYQMIYHSKQWYWSIWKKYPGLQTVTNLVEFATIFETKSYEIPQNQVGAGMAVCVCLCARVCVMRGSRHQATSDGDS